MLHKSPTVPVLQHALPHPVPHTSFEHHKGLRNGTKEACCCCVWPASTTSQWRVVHPVDVSYHPFYKYSLHVSPLSTHLPIASSMTSCHQPLPAGTALPPLVPAQLVLTSAQQRHQQQAQHCLQDMKRRARQHMWKQKQPCRS